MRFEHSLVIANYILIGLYIFPPEINTDLLKSTHIISIVGEGALNTIS